MIKRVRHMIEIISKITMIFMNHVANSAIVNQIKLTFSNIDKFNLRLIRVFTYLSQFQLNIKYRFDKQHVISNVFFRLSIVNEFNDQLNASNALNLNIFFNFMKVHFNDVMIFDVIDINIYHDDIEDSELSKQMYIYQNIIVVMTANFKTRLFKKYQREFT